MPIYRVAAIYQKIVECSAEVDIGAPSRAAAIAKVSALHNLGHLGNWKEDSGESTEPTKVFHRG